jgi:D-alanyl-D-alanine carboxypeptidase (penicillin-binding protein 5/6)
MLIVSACNYAEAVSTWAYGSQQAFLAATKKWLAAHGLNNTRIVEPTGVDAHNVSTPADLITLGKIAHADPVVSKIVAMPKLNVLALPNIGNNNDLLGTNGVDGIKTGTLDGSGSNLLFSASVDIGRGAPVSVIGVVLNAASRDEVDASVQTLITSLTSGFHEVPLINAGVVIGSYRTAWGETAQVVTGEGTSLFTWSNQAITAKIASKPVTRGKTGTVVGQVEFASATNTAQVPLQLKGTIGPPDAWWKLSHPQRIFDK